MKSAQTVHACDGIHGILDRDIGFRERLDGLNVGYREHNDRLTGHREDEGFFWALWARYQQMHALHDGK